MNLEDLFQAVPLTESITNLPVPPGLVGSLGLFVDKGVRTTAIAIEIRDEKLALVPAGSRRADPPQKGSQARRVVTLDAVHLAVADSVLPEDVQDVRAFGQEATESGLESQAQVIADKLSALKTDLETTREYHRFGAIQGKVLDADGVTVLYDLFDKFGVTQQTVDFAFSVDSTNVRKASLDIKRHIEKKTAGLVVSGIIALASPEFFDALTDHKNVKAAYANWQAAQDRLGGDMRKGFEFGGITYIDCPDEVNGVPFIPAGKARAFPVARGAYVTFNAPANYNEAANTVGQPFYAKAEPRHLGKGWDLEAQSNPLTLCLVPAALVELTMS